MPIAYGSVKNGFLKSFHVGAFWYALTEAAGTFNVTPDKFTSLKASLPSGSGGGVAALQVTLCNFGQFPQK